MKGAMENLPTAIQNLPDFMNTLVSNQMSWISSGRSFKDGKVTFNQDKQTGGATGRSFQDGPVKIKNDKEDADTVKDDQLKEDAIDKKELTNANDEVANKSS